MAQQSIDNKKLFAEAWLEGASKVTNYVKECSGNLESILDMTPEEARIKNLYDRINYWMQTLVKLNNRLDFQAIRTCVRSLFETTIDLILLCNDKTGQLAEKMSWWEKAQKLKAATKINTHYKKQNISVPQGYQPQIDFINREAQLIEQKKKLFWPKRLPQRWTGNNLEQDASVADTYVKGEIEKDLEMNLETFYATEMSALNWHVHGSTLTGFPMDYEGGFFDLLCAFSYKHCMNLAMFCSKLLIKKFGLVQYVAQIEENWKNIRKEIILSCSFKLGYITRQEIAALR